MFKKLIVPVTFASVLAATLASVSDRRGFEELAIRAAIAEEVRDPNTKCPLSPVYTDAADIDALSLCLRYGLAAYQAAKRYPDSAAKVFAVYGGDETFQKVFDRLGSDVIPVVAYFVEHGSTELQLRQAAGQAMQQIWDGKRPTWATVTREQIGLIAIYQLERRGHEMLAEFEIVDGKALRKPIRRLFFGVKNMLLGGVDDIETVLVRGERLPSWKEVGFAALDVTIIAGGIGAVAKVARLGIGTAEAAEESAALTAETTAETSSVRLAAEGAAESSLARTAAEGAAESSLVRTAAEGAAETSLARTAAEGAYEAIVTVGKASAVAAPVAVAYVAVTRPQLVASAGGWIAERLGAHRLVGIFAVYLVGLLLVMQILRPFIWFARVLARPVLWLARSRPVASTA
jgi:hypothetical protein